MKAIIPLLFVLLTTSATAGVSDPTMGLYFDIEGTETCLDGIETLHSVELFLILKNPSFDALHGFEVGISHGVLTPVVNTTFANPEAVNVGSDANMIVSFGTPTITEPATLLATVWVLYMDGDGGAAFLDLVGSEPSSIDPLFPVVILADGELMQTPTETTLGSEHEAQINWCGVPVEESSLDGVKSLYR